MLRSLIGWLVGLKLMPDFYYKGMAADGALVVGEYACADEQELDEWLLSKNIELLEFRKRVRWIRGQGVIDSESFEVFTSQLSQLLKAGVPLMECLMDLKKSQEKRGFASVLEKLYTHVESGKTLSLALESTGLAIPPLAIPLIRVGEKSGNLAESLAELCIALKWQKSVAERCKKAVFYPLFSGSVLFLVCTFLMTYLVPSLVSFIRSTSYDLPWYTKLLINVSDHIRDQGLGYLVALAVIAASSSFLYRHSKQTRLLASTLVLKLAWLGPVLFRIKISRFTYFTGVLYQAGVPIISALTTSRDILGSLHLERQMDSVIAAIESGEGIGDSFNRANVFPPFIARMLLTGEKTGRLDQSLLLISEHYQDEAEKAIARLEQMIGPVLILCVGSFLVWIIISVIGPIYEVVLSLGQNA